MNLHGKGAELQSDFVDLFTNKDVDGFKKKWGEGLPNIMFDNFMYPLFANTDKPEKLQELKGKLNLFYAAFFKPI